MEGGIYAILNPSYFRSKQVPLLKEMRHLKINHSQRTTAALSIKNPAQVIFIGPWFDFARCKAQGDGGKACGAIIDGY